MQDKKIQFTGERFIPEIDDKKLEIEHYQRYMGICDFVAEKNVLDAACGEGYGSFLMAEYASSVVGIDISESVVSAAKIKYSSRKNLKFLVGNIFQLPMDDESMDIVVSYETIEHVDEITQLQFLKEIARVLKPSGVLIMSTPNKAIYSDRYQYQNEFHKKEFYKEEFVSFLKSEFLYIKLYNQFFEVSSIVDSCEEVGIQMQYFSDHNKQSRNGKYYIAIASKEDVSVINLSSVYLGRIGEYEENIQRILKLQKEEENRNNHIRKQDCKLTEKGKLIKELQEEIAERNIHIQKLDKELLQIREYVRISDEALQQKILELEKANEDFKKYVIDTDENFKKYVIDMDEEKQSYNIQINHLMKIESDLRQQIEQQTEESVTQNRCLEQLKERFYDTECSTAELKKDVNELEDKLENVLKEAENKELSLQQIICNKEGHIELLLEVERIFEREKATRSYKFAKYMQRVNNIILPLESKRRFFIRILFNVFRSPGLMFHVINPARIKNYMKYMREEGMSGVKSRYEIAVAKERSYKYPAECLELELEKKTDNKDWESYEKLEFAQYDEPMVSIIIPVFNEFEYTYNCLKSILKKSGNVSYEIIIADDCSTDTTTHISKIINNVKVFTTDQNIGFLLNCKNAAKHANGIYLLFLNNDTQVQSNWLEPMTTLMEKDDTVGMVGAKLLYEDGRLQEAGGIVWNDASAWNYGHLLNPEDAQFNYVKEVDYVSGAAMMIWSKLWEEIGGFDERFIPAYYEDTDLAFEVRKHGYKVVFQPLSKVVHFEGISNGTDLETGIKQYQTDNCLKFLEKWKEVLKKEHVQNGSMVFKAKDRCLYKKHILVVDHYVPHHDKDAGGKCTYMYLKLFLHMGFKVTFIGDNFYNHEPYTTELNQMGIEVLYGNYYYHNWEIWIKENGHYFDYVYLQRPHISVKYIDLVKEYSKAKIFYFAHDLHHIRERREYELTFDPEKLKSSENWKIIEYELFHKADVGHVVGSYEQEIMQKALPDKPIRNIPLYIYESMIENINKDFSARKDLIYVGGFGHPPNIDAVLWFAGEVFPEVLKIYPDIKWHVVGGKVPKKIAELANRNILIEGFVPDDQLDILYRKCRMAVVPLRVGAGVKGKVVEAAYYQIPLITTTIGAEGLDHTVGNFIIADEAKGMAGQICELYENYSELTKMSDSGKKFIEDNFTLSVAEEVIRLDVDIEFVG